ncbi:MAG TPA: dihydrolipoyl dehydrogenase [Caldithrix abyssi]|uniref:Dihydrolipoyl dehydrogenase n=1 Tax=Caldithrix abyssi TaxID=187145 RepID=A0A7V4TZT1_CALAY|nr:dihydrolipoyl dehydrogenase [Caldithrix abyssi]
MQQHYDLIVIGSGPGGYLAAERAGNKGLKVLLVEKEERLGGVCLNRGCIPTKTWLHSAKIFYKAQNSVQYGVSVSGAEYHFEKAVAWKNKVVDLMTKGVSFRMKRSKVTTLRGFAEFKHKNTLKVGSNAYRADNIIIATGSSAALPPIEGIDRENVFTSDTIFSIEKLPRKAVIIGGGVIGLEFASYFGMVGVEVTVLEMLPEILPQVDVEIAKALGNALKNCTIITDARVQRIENRWVVYRKNGNEMSCEADLVLLAAGRAPNVQGLGLERLNLDYSSRGIEVNDRMQTNIPGIFAVGDVTGKSALAHSAYRMAEVAVNTITGIKDRMRYHAIPWVIYTYPELSGVGLSEAQAAERGYHTKSKTLQLRANGRFYAEHGREQGLCKVVVDAENNLLLGLFLLGGTNSEIIYGAALMIEAELRVRDIKEIIFPHPTVSEAIKDTLWELEDTQ